MHLVQMFTLRLRSTAVPMSAVPENVPDVSGVSPVLSAHIRRVGGVVGDYSGLLKQESAQPPQPSDSFVSHGSSLLTPERGSSYPRPEIIDCAGELEDLTELVTR